MRETAGIEYISLWNKQRSRIGSDTHTPTNAQNALPSAQSLVKFLMLSPYAAQLFCAHENRAASPDFAIVKELTEEGEQSLSPGCRASLNCILASPPSLRWPLHSFSEHSSCETECPSLAICVSPSLTLPGQFLQYEYSVVSCV